MWKPLGLLLMCAVMTGCGDTQGPTAPTSNPVTAEVKAPDPAPEPVAETPAPTVPPPEAPVPTPEPPAPAPLPTPVPVPTPPPPSVPTAEVYAAVTAQAYWFGKPAVPERFTVEVFAESVQFGPTRFPIALRTDAGIILALPGEATISLTKAGPSAWTWSLNGLAGQASGTMTAK